MYSRARAIRAVSLSPSSSGDGSNGWSARDRNGAPDPSPSAAPEVRFSAIAPVLLGPSRPAILPGPGITPPAGPPRLASRQSNRRGPFGRSGGPTGYPQDGGSGRGAGCGWRGTKGRPAEGGGGQSRSARVVRPDRL